MMGIPYTGSGVSACIRAADKVLAKHAMRDARHPDARLLRLQRDRLPGARRRRRRCRRSRSGSSSRSWSSRPARARRSGSSSRAPPADVPAALVAAFSYDRKVLLERYVDGRELAVSIIDETAAPRALPIVEAVPEQEDFYDFEARYEIGRTRFVCPAELDAGVAERAQRDRARGLRAARLRGLRPRRPDARVRARRAVRARGQRDPRPDRDQPAAPGRRGGRDRLRRADRADPRGAQRPRRLQPSRGSDSAWPGATRRRSPPA